MARKRTSQICCVQVNTLRQAVHCSEELALSSFHLLAPISGLVVHELNVHVPKVHFPETGIT